MYMDSILLQLNELLYHLREYSYTDEGHQCAEHMSDWIVSVENILYQLRQYRIEENKRGNNV